MDEIGNAFNQLRDIASCLAKHFCKLLHGHKITSCSLVEKLVLHFGLDFSFDHIRLDRMPNIIDLFSPFNPKP